MPDIEFRLQGGLVRNLASTGDPRALLDEDWSLFSDWVRLYHELAWRPRTETELLDLGGGFIGGWTEKSAGWRR